QGNITDGNNGQAVDAKAAPSVSGLVISGSLLSGNSLRATYTFNPGNGNKDDRSRYAWGNVNSTSGDVAVNGQTVTNSGTVPDRPVT
ncbi:hypothetical protein ABKV83_23795, partial [Enterobacter asburiae]|uniref:hypothetical protein n=1 Tax=Enterobacter asburiae TaxID=61645 RepID=UPI0032AEF491